MSQAGPRVTLRSFALLLVTAIVLAVVGTPARAQTLSSGLYITNGQVITQALRDSTLYLGGSFTNIGPVTGAGVPVDSITALPTANFPVVNGIVLTAISDGAGGWFLGGQFTAVGDQPRANLARVLFDGTVSSWNPGANGAVRTLALRAGVLYAGGDFLTLGGLTRNRIGAVDANAGSVTAWDPNANASVRSIVATTTQLFVGGQFTSIGGAVRNRIAQVNATTGAAVAGWDPNSNGTVLAMAADEVSGTLYVGGQFTFAGGITRNRVAAFETATGVVTDFNTGANNSVFAIAVTPTAVYLGGQFTVLGVATRNRIAAVDPATGTPTFWNPNANNIVQSIAVSGNTVYAGGDFLTMGVTSRSRVAAIDAFSGALTSWDPAAFGSVSVVAAANGKILVGGSFNGMGGAARSNLAAIDLRTNQVTSWAPNPNNVVNALVAGTDRMIVGGTFTTLGGLGRNNLGAVDYTFGQATTWAPTVNGAVNAVSVLGNRVYAGGLFTLAGGQAHTNLAAFDATTAQVLPWTANPDDQVFTVEATSALVRLGGNFLNVNGTPRGFIAAVDTTTGALTSWAPEANAAVRTITTVCDRVFVGGTFTSIGGQIRNRAATVSATTGLADSWHPDANGPIFSILPRPGVVYLGGVMTAVGGQVRNRLAAVDPTSGLLTSWNPNSNGTVRQLVADASRVFAGGTFSSILGLPSGNLAGLSVDASASCPTITFTPASLPNAPENGAYSTTLAAIGGAGPYCYAITAGALPAGLTFDGASGVISGTSPVSGTANFTVTATDVRGCSGSANYSLTTAPAGGLSFPVAPSTVAAGAVITPAVQVLVRDLTGTILPGETVTLTLVGTGTLSGTTSAVADANGIATFANLSIDLAGAKQLTAASGVLPNVNSIAFNVTSGPATAFAFSVQPSNVVAGVAMTPAVKVHVSDVFGNNVVGTPVTLALLGSGTLTGGAAQATDANGVATFSVLSVNLAGSKQLTATVGALTPVTSTAFTVSPAAASALAFTTQPSAALAGATIAPAVKVRVSDAFGNAIAGSSVTLALTGTGTLTGGGAQISDTAGVATFAGLSINLAGSKQLSAASGALPTAASTAFTISAGPAATLAFAVQPSNAAAGAAIAPAVQVRVSDAFGNAVAGSNVALSLVGTGTLTGGAAVTSDVNGNATFNSLSINLAGSKQLTATSGVLPSATSSAFTISAGPAATLAFQVQPSNVVAGVAIAPAVQVRAADAFGNSVAGASVALALTGTGTLSGGAAQLTNASGIATFSALSVNLAGSKQLVASSGAITPVSSSAFTVSAAAANALSFSVQPSNTTAGALMSPAVQVLLADAFGNPVSGGNVTLALTGTGTLTGGGAQLTNASGIATFSALSVDLAGSKQFVASSGALTPATSSAFTIHAAAAANLGFAVQPANAAAGVTIAPAVQVRVTDAFGNNVAGSSVALSLVGTGTLTGGAAQLSNASGIATFSALSVNLAGSKQLAATSGVLPSATSASFTISAGPAASLSFQTQPSNVVAGSAIAPAVEVRVSDAFGNAVAGTSVTLALTGTGTLSGGAAQLSNASGIASFPALSVNLTGSKQLVASSGILPGATSTAFTVSAGPAASLSFQTQPTSVVAGVAIAPAVQVRVSDALGNAVAGSSISLALSGTGTLSGTTLGTSDASGLAAFAGLSVDLAGAKQLVASSGALPNATSTSFTVAAAGASTLSFQTQPSNVVAGATMSPAVQVRVTDAFGNNVAGRNVGLTLVGSGTLTGGGSHVTDAAGIATFNPLSVDLAGTKQLTASSGVLTPATSSAFSVSAGPAATLSFATAPSNVTAGTAIAPAVRVRVADALGNAVSGSSVALALVGSGTLSGGAAVLSDTTGIATFAALSIDLAGSKQLTASSGALTPVSSSAFTVSPAAASTLAFETQPSNSGAGVAIAPAVQVRASDAFGNRVAGVPVSLALTGTGTLSGTALGSTDSNGLATFATLSVDLLGSKQLVASSGVLPNATSSAFTISAGPAASLAFTTQPSNVTAGVAIAPAVRVRVSDAFGNAVAGSNVALTLTGTGTLSGAAPVASDASGIAEFAALSIDLAGSKQLSASSGALTTVQSNTFSVSPAAAAVVTFAVAPTPTSAGAAITPAVQVKVADAFGNGISGQSVALSLTGTGTLLGGAATATDSNGLATFAALSIDLAGSKQLTASSGALTPATSAAFTISPAAAHTIAFVTQPSNTAAGATLSPAVQVQLTDAFGNAVAGSNVSLALSGTGTLTGGAAALTGANGIATFAALSIDLAGSKQLIASSGALTPATSAAFTISPAVASTLVFTTQPSNALAGAALSPAVQVRVSDAFGNAISGTPIALALSGTGTLSGGAAVASDDNGIATFSALSVTLAGNKQLVASSGTLPSATSASFVISPAAAASLAFATPPSDVAAGALITPAVRIQVADAFGNGVAGASVSLALTGSGTLTGGAAVASDASGIATFGALSVNTAGSKQLSAASGVLPNVTSGSFNVTPAVPAALAFATQPSNSTAGAAIAPAVRVHVTDALGNDVPGAPVTLALTGSGVLSGGAAVATDASGIATFAALSIDLAGSKQLAASTGALPAVNSSAFTIAPAAAASVAFTAQPGNVVAGATLSPAVQVRVADAFGNGVSGASVSLALTGSGALTGGGAVLTNASGIATFGSLSVNLAGSKQLTATSGALPGVASTSFTVAAAAAANVTFTTPPSNVTAGVAISPAVRVRVSDAFGNDVSGAAVALSLIGTGTLSGGAAVLTDATGTATFAGLSITLAGGKQLSATTGALTPVTSSAFTVSPAAAATLAFATPPSNVTAGATITPAVRVQVSDAFGNSVTGASVALTLAGTGTLSGGSAVLSDASGIATFAALSIDTAGSKQLTASSGALTPVTSAAFTVSPAGAAVLAFATQPSATVAGASITPAVRIQVSDALGNAVAGTSVTLSLVGTGTVSGITTVSSDANGIARFAGLSIDLAGAKQFTATSGALAGVSSSSFNITPAAASAISFATAPSNAIAGAAIAPAVRVKVADAFGNGISGRSVSLALTGTGTLTGGAAVVTDTNGIATFASLSVNLAGSKQLVASNGALTPATSPAFAISAGAAAQLAFVSQVPNVVAGATISPAVRVRVSDAFGNDVAGSSVALTLVGTGTLTGGGAVLSDAAGIATFAAVSINATGTKQLTATSGALAPVTSVAFAVSAGPAATLTFVSQIPNVTAGTTISPAVRVHVTDALGNDVAGSSVALTLVGTGSLSGGGATLSDAAGIATFANLLLDTVGNKQLTATSGALTPVTSTLFAVSPGTASTLSFATQPSNTAAGVLMTPAVRVHVTDAFGNDVAGQGVTLSLIGSGALSGTLSQTSDAAGMATFAGLSIATAGSKQLTAASGTLTSINSLPFTIASATPSTIAFTVQPSTVTAGATLAPAVQLLVSDAFGNAVAGAGVSLALTGTGTLSGGATVASDANGIATFAALSLSATGTKRLTATTGALAPVTSQPFVVSAAAASAIAYAAQPSDAVAGTAMSPTVAVRVTDAWGNGVAGASIVLTLNTPSNPPNGPVIGDAAGFAAPVESSAKTPLANVRGVSGLGPVTADSTGTARFPALLIDAAGNHALLASSGVLSVTSQVFTISPAAATALSFVSQPGNAAVNAALSPPVQVRVQDAFGNAVPNSLVSVTLAGPGTLTGGGATASDATGTATFGTLAVGTPGTHQLVASSGALASITSQSFQVACPVVSVAPDTLAAGTLGLAYHATLSALGGVAPYTFDVTLGTLPPGLTLAANGTLDGTPTTATLASFSITATDANGCSGARTYSIRVLGLPAAIADLAVTRLAGIADGDGTQPMRITFTTPAFADSVEVYRAPFGGYPRYDEAGGVAPAAASYPPSAPWVRTPITASGQSDDPAVRDAYRYIAFARNAAGQHSPASNVTLETTNYLLGDFSNAAQPGQGDNRVDFADVSLLGAHYGISGAALVTDGVSYLDIGPTLDHTMATRPVTDGRVDFEDLIVLVTNYGGFTTSSALAASADGMIRSAQGRERFSVVAPVSVRAGETFTATVHLQAAGRIQGARVQLGWNAEIAEPVSMKSTTWVKAQDGVVFSGAPGQIDAALLGVRDAGFTGDGELAVVTFRALRDGDADVRLADVEARDAANRTLSAELVDRGVRAPLPQQTLLFAPAPNPCRAPATLSFALAKGGRADLALYSVDGRRVRTIASGVLAAGTHQYVWTGEDDSQRKVAPGVYFARLVTDGPRFTRKLVLLP